MPQHHPRRAPQPRPGRFAGTRWADPRRPKELQRKTRPGPMTVAIFWILRHSHESAYGLTANHLQLGATRTPRRARRKTPHNARRDHRRATRYPCRSDHAGGHCGQPQSTPGPPTTTAGTAQAAEPKPATVAACFHVAGRMVQCPYPPKISRA